MGKFTKFVFLAPILLALLTSTAYAETAPPIWSAQWNSTPETFNTSAQLRFNITWADGNPLHALLIEVNRSGILTNHTPSAARTGSFYLNTSTDYLELDEQIDAVGTTALTAAEMSDLSAGTVTNAKGISTYNQTLAVAETAAVTYAIDPDDATDTPAWYLRLDAGSIVYRYNLSFNSTLTSDINSTPTPGILTDFIGLNFTLAGLRYTLTNASWDSGNITLGFSGLDNNDIFSLGDTNITNDAAGGMPVAQPGNNITDVIGQVVGSNTSTNVTLTHLSLTWTASEDIYAPVGSYLTLKEDDNQLFLDFDIEFVAVLETASKETITLRANGDDQYVLNFTNKANQNLSVPLFDIDELDLKHGDEDSALHVAEGDGTWTEAYTLDVNDMFVVSDSTANNTYLLRYLRLNTSGEIYFEDIGAGSNITVSYAWAGTNQSAAGTLTVGGEDYDVYVYANATDADILVDLDHDGSLILNTVPRWYTLYGAKIGVHATPSQGFNITSIGGGDALGAAGEAITVTVANSTANATEIGSVGGAVTLQTIGATDDREDYGVWGTHVYRINSSGPDTLNITYPLTQTLMQVRYLTGRLLNTYNLTLTEFPAGTHAWRSHANDTYGNTNTTSWQFFTINKTAPTLRLLLGSTAGPTSITTGSIIWLNGSVMTGDGGAVLTLFVAGVQQTNGTSVADSHTFSTAGTYNISLNYTTTQNYTNALLSYLVTVADAPASSGGSGGGPAPTKTEPAPSATRFIVSVSKESGIDMSISNAEIPVSEIKVEVTNTAANVEIKVTARDELPASVDEAPKASSGTSRTVYKYLEIEHKNLAGKIEQATIGFRVAKEWLTNNSFDKSQITLQRHSGSAWEELPTEIAKETTDNVHYNATTTGFSVFAISVKDEEPAAEEESGEEGLVTGPSTEEPGGEQPETPQEETPDEGAKFPWGWVLGFLIIIVISAGSFVVLKLRSQAGMTPAQPPAARPRVRRPLLQQPPVEQPFFRQPKMPRPPVQSQQPSQEPAQQMEELQPPPEASPEQETPASDEDEGNSRKILEYIPQCRGMGIPDGTILDNLLEAGYELDLVYGCFKSLKEQPSTLMQDDSAVIAYIRQCRAKGFPDSAILKQLIKAGHDVSLVNECFRKA